MVVSRGRQSLTNTSSEAKQGFDAIRLFHVELQFEALRVRDG